MRFIIRNWLVIFLFVGLLLRFGLMFLDFSFDVNNHIAWAKDLHLRGFSGFYEIISSEVYAVLYPNYPPFAMYLFYPLYALNKVIFNLLWWLNVTIPLFPSTLVLVTESRSFIAGMFKLPAIVADLALAWMIYLFARKIKPKDIKMQVVSVALILFHPVIFYNSSYWGQIDSIPLFFTLAAFYLLFYKKNSLLSMLVLTAALLVKPTPLVFIPVYLLFYLSLFSWRKLLRDVFISNLVYWISFLPFHRSGIIILYPYSIYIKNIVMAQSLDFVTNGAFNIWNIIPHVWNLKDTTPFFAGLSYRILGYILTTIAFSAILYRSSKEKKRVEVFIFAACLSAMLSYLFLTKMHERYIILPIPFLILLIGTKRKMGIPFVILSIIGFMNMYNSWPVPMIEIVRKLISDGYVISVLSLVQVLIGVYLLYYYLRKKANRSNI